MSKIIDSKMKYATDKQVIVVGTIYQDGSPALLIRDLDGQPLAKATIHISEYMDKRGDMDVIIKDYSENEGMLETLISEGIIEDTGDEVSTSFVKMRICVIVDFDIIDEIMADRKRVA